jgi:hypothetical protein
LRKINLAVLHASDDPRRWRVCPALDAVKQVR